MIAGAQRAEAASARAAWSLLILGLIGALASFTLTYEDFKLLTEPGYKPSCSINPIIACGSVMETDQAHVFGFPNPILGVIGFSIVVTIAVIAVAGIALPRWFWGGLWLGLLAGLGMICWFVFQALYRINALCPYCMVVWAITPILFAVVTALLWSGSPRTPLRIISEWRWMFVVVWYAVILLLVFLRFQDYWVSLF